MTDRATVGVEATLTVRRNGTTFDVWTEDDLLVVNAPSLSALRALDSLRGLPVPADVEWTDDSAGGQLTTLVTDFPVELRVRHAPVARVGGDVAPSPLARRALGRDARIDWRGVAVAAVRALG